MTPTNGLPAARAAFAKSVADAAGLRSSALRRALGVVPREAFFESGPWDIWQALPTAPHWGYRTTADADPSGLYEDAGVRLLPGQELNSGRPSMVARLIDALAIKPGASVFQVGCGNGYFTALLSEMVGPRGSVLAVEVDPHLAAFAATALAGYGNVTVLAKDAAQVDPGPVDAILTHAGVTRLPRLWATRLKAGGSLVITLSTTVEGAGANTPGVTFLVKAEDGGLSTKILGFPVIYPCSSLRADEEDRALRVLLEAGEGAPRSVRLDAHVADEACWLHGDGWCLSRAEVAAGLPTRAAS